MSLFSSLLAIVAAIGFVVSIIFILFGEKTVRKLRKNPATKNALGIEFINGMDILNVATALALPRRLTHFLRKSPIAALHADVELLNKHTTRLDRILAKIFFYLWMFFVLAILILMFLDLIGVFK